MPQNQLADSTSPYLQQHADNPVAWQPWGEQALKLAQQQQKPILLSIGYSACHWCHVMAHESFEDPQTAELMNRLFINIKVDREERPDLDRIYQTAHQLLAQRPGGWPLTLFLAPDDQGPFFAGTYFPPEARHGLPAFRDLLQHIADAWQQQREQITEQNRSLQSAFSQLEPRTGDDAAAIDSAPLELARQQLAHSFDEQYGGFGKAPKFPHPTSLNRLLRHWAATNIGGNADARALYLADHTLEQMALGGINDQIGGGFCRYSVDDQWMIPHFEKMLYDNGPLLQLYSDLWQATGKQLFHETAGQIADWVMREMQSPHGGYYSSLDADSEGGEGLFYLWHPQQAQALLTADEYAHLAARYGLDRPANFEGSWHLHTFNSIAQLNQQLDSSAQQARTLLASARGKLLEARRQRIRPGRDEKILSGWNALMIKGMARAGRLLQRPELIDSAERALAFIRAELWRDGRLLATHRAGHSQLNAYLDDHAWLIDALLELLQARWRSADLQFAIALAERLLERFEDDERGGFYFTADDHERLIHRPRPFSDDATPSGNGIAALALIRLGHLLGETRYLAAAERTLRAAWEQLRQLPQGHCSLLDALEEQLYPTETIVIRGPEEQIQRWAARASRHYAPRRFSVAIADTVDDLPGLLAQRSGDGLTTAWICSGTRCEQPISDYRLFEDRLSSSECTLTQVSEDDFTGGAGSFRRARE